MDEISICTYVAADGTTTVTVVDRPDQTLTIPPTSSAAERDAQIVAWVEARRAEAGTP